MKRYRLLFMIALLTLPALLVAQADESVAEPRVPTGRWVVDVMLEAETDSMYENGDYLMPLQAPPEHVISELAFLEDGTGALTMESGENVSLFYHLEKFESFGAKTNWSLYLQPQGRQSVYLDYHLTEDTLIGLISGWRLEGNRVDLFFTAQSPDQEK